MAPEKAKVLKIGFVAAGLELVRFLWKKKAICRRLRKGNRSRDRRAVIEEVDSLPEAIYKKMFRVDRDTFEAILEKVEEQLPSHRDPARVRMQVKGYSGQELSNRIKLMCTLRYLAGGSYWDICFGFKVGFGSFFMTVNMELFGQ